MARTGLVKEYIGPAEFKMCGGSPKRSLFSFYRQLVYAKRDVMHWAHFGGMPLSAAIVGANKLFVFHDSDDEDLIEDGKMNKDASAFMMRTAMVLKLSREALRSKNNLKGIHLSPNEYANCGGCKGLSKKKKAFSFYTRLVKSKREWAGILQKAHKFPSRGAAKNRIYDEPRISDDEEEDVDTLDGYEENTVYECSVDDADFVDEEEEDMD